MNPFDSETLRLVLIFFIPGFISIKVYDLFIPSERRDFSASLMDAVSYSCINFALTYWIITLIHSSNFQVDFPFWYYFSSIFILFIAPIIWPILFLKILSYPYFKKRTIDPLPKPWDSLFSQKEAYWVIIHLKDGRRIGGRFDDHSFASMYPAAEQIYIEEVWQLDSKGKFLNKIEGSKGLIISQENFEAIEFFE